MPRGIVYIPVAERVREAARQMLGAYTRTPQFPYRNPGQNTPSIKGIDLIEGPPSMKMNEPWSRRRDIKKKYDTVWIGPGPNISDVFDKDIGPYPAEPEDPKTDEQGKVRNVTKARGDDKYDLDRDTYRTEGGPGSAAHV